MRSPNLTRYLTTVTATTLLCLAAAFTFNALVDPLWYYSGNRFAPINFAFNERLSKVNLIAGRESEYDCVIFGDSRVTLLPADRIADYKCFNFAFSAGAVNEFVAYSKWLQTRGFAPKLVIVGVSAGDFRRRTPPRNIPEIISENRNPTPAIIKYLSLDVIGMSWRTLFGTTPIDRIYNRDFQCLVAVTTPYDTRKPIRDIHSGPFDTREPLDQYRALREIFPSAKFVGYTPPISAWAIADYAKINWLESYVHALIDAASVFDAFVDASVPSDITVEPANTYDGTHYSSGVNAEIASKLLSNATAPALNLKGMDIEGVLSVYHERLKTYSNVIAAGESVPPVGTSPTQGLPSR
ncbi:MAG: hypothetical protein Q7T44_00790 [Parvibaculum sp.]|nr:hypothetical protein [Parvibaculum sp.]